MESQGHRRFRPRQRCGHFVAPERRHGPCRSIEKGRYQSTATTGALGAEWKIEGTGDFDRDGDADILWQRTDGLVRVDLIENGKYQSTAVTGALGPEWKIEGTGDFDRDGDADILWHRNDGII